MMFNRRSFIFVLGLLTVFTSLTTAQLLENPDFEAQSLSPHWLANAKLYQLDHAMVRTGKSSLQWANNDPRQYLHAKQNVELDPASEYTFEAWIKTQDVKDGYVTIAVEFYADDRFHSGTYPKGITGTEDWTHVKTDSFVLPKGATKAHVMCYARRGTTGQAWFDDLALTEVKSQIMHSALRYPAYRGFIGHGQQRDISLRVKLADHLPADARLQIQLLDHANQVIHSQKNTVKTGVNDIVIQVITLPTGQYNLQLRLADDKQNELATMTHRINVVEASKLPSIMIDEHQRLLVNGKPVMPIGVYDNTRITDDELKLLQDSAVNCVLTYGTPTRSLLDRLDAHDLKLIASVKDFFLGHKWTPKNLTHVDDEAKLMRPLVKSLRDHPAMLAWYLNDELPLSYMDRFKAHYQWIIEDDPAHPAFSVLMRPHQINRYLHTADVLGSDPYPLPHKPIELAGQWTQQTVSQTLNARPVWQVVQAFNWQNYQSVNQHQTGQTPTQAQLRNMIWQCLTNGANGILLYSLYDMQRNPDIDFDTYWPQVTKVLAEVQRHSQALLSIQSPPKVTIHSGDNPCLSMRVTQWQDATYVFVVNTSDKPQTTEFQINKPIKSIQELSTEQTLTATDSQHWQDTLKPLDVRMYRITTNP